MSCFFIPKHSSYSPDSHLHHLIHQHNKKKVLPLTFAFSSHFILLLRMVFNRTHIVFISLHICVEPHDQHVPINHAFFFASFFVCATVFSRSRIFSFFFYLIFCVCSTAITRSRIFFFTYCCMSPHTVRASDQSVTHLSFFFLPLALSARYGHQPVSHLLFFFFTSFVCVRALPSPHMYIYIYFSPHA